MYLRIKDLLHPKAIVNHSLYGTHPTREHWAKTLAATFYPVQVLTAELSCEADLATGLCDDLSVISSP